MASWTSASLVWLAAGAAACAWAVRRVVHAPYGEGAFGRARLAGWKAWKGALRRWTGQSEVERLCVEMRDEPQAALTGRLDASFALSAQLRTLRRDLRKATLDAGLAATNVVAVKRLPGDAEGEVVVRRRVRAALEDIAGVNRLDATLAEARTPYDRANRHHEALLLRLWSLLRPGEELGERYTPRWGEIGFQGTDPATDFRGMGLLGLQNLVAFAERYPEEAGRVLADTERPAWFSFAITGLNLTADMCRLVSERRLCNYFFSQGATVDSFNRLYALLFVRFNRLWEETAPPTVMVFQDVRRQFLAAVERDDAEGALAHQEV